MEKVSFLSQQSHSDRQRDKNAPTPAEQSSRLTHAIMNQLTVIYLSCAKLRRGLPPDSFAKEESEIQIIEAAVAQIAKQVEALRFRLEKTTRRAKARSGKFQKLHSKTKLSFISPRGSQKHSFEIRVDHYSCHCALPFNSLLNASSFSLHHTVTFATLTSGQIVLKGVSMIALKKLITVGSLTLGMMMMSPSPSESKRILEILRDKGVITEEEYRQAIEEAKGKDEEMVKEAKAEASKQFKLPDWLHRASFFGDIRYRHEGFYNSELQANNPTRNRERIRVRLGLGVDLSPELSGQLRIVTGDANDPISTNQTLTDLFTRKPINLDWAFIKASPWQIFGLDKMTGSEKPMLSITAGKQPVPLFRPGGSELVFDSDLSPEGVSEDITLWDRPGGFVRNFKITGLQWSIKEISNSSATQLFNPGRCLDVRRPSPVGRRPHGQYQVDAIHGRLRFSKP
jgi:hypothetical protein